MTYYSSDKDMIETRYNHFYIHNVFGGFVKDTMDYFAEYLYPRFGPWKIIGTYDKAVEYLNKQTQHARETDQPLLPALILDPSGEFNFDDKYGKLLYRYPNLAPGMAKYIWTPIYQDQNILMTVGFGRVVGEFNFTAILASFYEYTDMRIYLLTVFGGLERPIYPQWFNSFVVLPQEICDYVYVNDVTGETYKLDIENAYNLLIKTTNQNELVYPCKILPRYRLTGLSDASSRLGGVDGLPSWKLNFTLAYEIEMPTYLILESDYLAEKLNVDIGYGSCYTKNNVYVTEKPSVSIDSFTANISHGLDSTSNTEITYPIEATITNKKSRDFKTRYYHIVTQSEVDSTSVVEITIPEVITDRNLLRLNGKYGNLVYGDHYTINTEGTTLTINKENVTLELGDILEIYIYEYT